MNEQQSIPSDRLLYTREEVAQLLKTSEMTVRRLVSRGLLRPVRGLWRCRISKAEVERFVADSSVERQFNIKIK